MFEQTMRTSVAALFAGLVLILAPVAAAKPNIVVLMTDDQTLDSMSVMPQTQRLLGKKGTTFTRNFVNYSLCCPSRATLYTGQYAHNHGVLGNGPPVGGYTRLDTSNWLPLWLQAAGYRTMHVGKFLNGYGRLSSPTEVPPGFNDWHGTVDPTTYSFWNYTVNENGVLHTYGAANEPEFYSTDFFARRANELIAAAAPSDQPFFMSVAFLAPHAGQPVEPGDPAGQPTPAPAPRHVNAFSTVGLPQPASFNEADMTDKPAAMQRRPLLTPERTAAIQESYQQRLESLLAVDEAVGSIVGGLDAAGELDDTLILFTSDNGFFHGEHRVPQGKILAYEPSIRLPLIMRGPGVPEDERQSQLVTNADLAPTILDAADAKAGRVQDGRSLFGLLDDPGVQWGRELLIEGGNNQGLTFTALRNYRWKYIEHRNGEVELYDLERDPDELTNVAADPALGLLRTAMATRLAALRVCAGGSCRAKPSLRLDAARRRCSFNAAVRGADARAIERVEFLVRRRPRRGARDAPASFRRLARDVKPRFRKRVRAAGVLPGRRFLMRARVRLGDGRSVTLDEKRRSCR
ncbi:MAG TPA: sulfatase [Thermoleophilaceae bacterium]|nr:sulfatase [Thermoleophilaceae bacterium]